MTYEAATLRRQERGEKRLPDRCTITWDPEGTTDDEFDPDTGTYTPPVDDERLIYEGPCSVYPDRVPSLDVSTGAPITIQRYRCRLPARVVPEVGMMLRLSRSLDASLLHRRFRIVGVERRSRLVNRIVTLEDPTQTPDTLP